MHAIQKNLRSVFCADSLAVSMETLTMHQLPRATVQQAFLWASDATLATLHFDQRRLHFSPCLLDAADISQEAALSPEMTAWPF